MTTRKNNTQQQLSQESSESATLKQKLSNSQIQPGQGLVRIDSILAGMGIAQRLGIRIEENCSLSNVAEVGQ